jgi:hypothetical protein
MFFEGASRLLASDCHIPGLRSGDSERIIVEAYLGVLARNLIGKTPYIQDDKKKQTLEHGEKEHPRRAHEWPARGLRIRVSAPSALADDPTGDEIDALLCAVQAAWAWTTRDQEFGMPEGTDPLEGWIADPTP